MRDCLPRNEDATIRLDIRKFFGFKTLTAKTVLP